MEQLGQLFEPLANFNRHQNNTDSVITTTNAGHKRSVRLEYMLSGCWRRRGYEQAPTQSVLHVSAVKPLGVCQRKDCSIEEQRLLWHLCLSSSHQESQNIRTD